MMALIPVTHRAGCDGRLFETLDYRNNGDGFPIWVLVARCPAVGDLQLRQAPLAAYNPCEGFVTLSVGLPFRDFSRNHR